jgi:putative ABC transport system permease protein
MTTTEGATTTARIVGLVDEFGMSVWTSPATFDRLATPNDRGRELRAIVDPALAAPALATAEQAIIASGNFPIASSTREGRRDGMVNHFFSFYQFLLVASLTAGIVGGAALSANIGANVLGRTREIGVLRALGTGSRTLFRLVLVQAFAVTLFSLLLAIVIGLPLSAFIVDQMEERALHMYMPLVISWPALAGLTAGALVLAALAAVAPAIRVRRLAIREAISVE